MLRIMVQLKCNNISMNVLTFFLLGMYVRTTYLSHLPTQQLCTTSEAPPPMKISFANTNESTARARREHESRREATTNSISTTSSFKMALRASIQRVSRDLPR